MKPKKPQNQPELFRAQLSQIINTNHPLVRLSTQINWERLESKIEIIYSEKGGQPPLLTRLLVGLHYLKYAFNESDESVVSRRSLGGSKPLTGNTFVALNPSSTSCLCIPLRWANGERR